MKASRTASTARSGDTACSTCLPVKTGTAVISAPSSLRSERFHIRRELGDRGLGVAEQHHGLRVDEEWVFDPGEPWGHRALEHDGRLRLVDVEDRHPEDRAPV